MPVLRIPTPLRSYTSGQSEVNVSGIKISEALTDLTTQYPTIKPHIFNDGGELRPFVNLFVGEHNIKDLQGVETPIKDGDRRSEEHTSELQSQSNLVCRLLLEKKN